MKICFNISEKIQHIFHRSPPFGNSESFTNIYVQIINVDALTLASLDLSFVLQNYSNLASIWIVRLETCIVDLTWQIELMTIKNFSFWVAIFILVTSDNCETGISRVYWWIEQYFILINSTAFVHCQLNVIGVQLYRFSTRSLVDLWSIGLWTWRRGSRWTTRGTSTPWSRRSSRLLRKRRALKKKEPFKIRLLPNRKNSRI